MVARADNTISANGFNFKSLGRSMGTFTYVTLRRPGKKKKKPVFPFGPHFVIQDVGTRVWIYAHHDDELDPEIKLVTDGVSNGMDQMGYRLVSVPVEWCTFITEADATEIDECMSINSQLESYAKA